MAEKKYKNYSDFCKEFKTSDGIFSIPIIASFLYAPGNPKE